MPLPPKPNVGSDLEIWGDVLNEYLDALAIASAQWPMFQRSVNSGLVLENRTQAAGGNGTKALNANTIYANWFVFPQELRITGMQVGVTAAAAGLGRMIVYADDPGQGPGGILVDAGTFDHGTTGRKTCAFGPEIWGPGIVWAAVIPAAAITVDAVGSNQIHPFGTPAAGGARKVSPSAVVGSTNAPDPFPNPFVLNDWDPPNFYLRLE